MSITRLCPVCRVGRVLRRDCKTCGAHDCLTIWRSLSSTQRAQLIEKTAEYEIQSVPSLLGYGTGGRKGVPPSVDSTSRDDEALRSIFGDDAPGLSEKDKK